MHLILKRIIFHLQQPISGCFLILRGTALTFGVTWGWKWHVHSVRVQNQDIPLSPLRVLDGAVPGVSERDYISHVALAGRRNALCSGGEGCRHWLKNEWIELTKTSLGGRSGTEYVPQKAFSVTFFIWQISLGNIAHFHTKPHKKNVPFLALWLCLCECVCGAWQHICLFDSGRVYRLTCRFSPWVVVWLQPVCATTMSVCLCVCQRGVCARHCLNLGVLTCSWLGGMRLNALKCNPGPKNVEKMLDHLDAASWNTRTCVIKLSEQAAAKWSSCHLSCPSLLLSLIYLWLEGGQMWL